MKDFITFVKDSWKYLKGDRYRFFRYFYPSWKRYKKQLELADNMTTIIPSRTRKQYVQDRKKQRKLNKQIRNRHKD